MDLIKEKIPIQHHNCKIYHKGFELQSNQTFLHQTIYKLVLDNLIRYEFTIKAYSTKNTSNQKKGFKADFKTLNDLLLWSHKSTLIAKSGLKTLYWGIRKVKIETSISYRYYASILSSSTDPLGFDEEKL
jgi:hypothetical protein